MLSYQVCEGRRFAFAQQANFQRRIERRCPMLFVQSAAVHIYRNALGIMRGEELIEGRIEQRLEMAGEGTFQKTGIDQRRQRVLKFATNRRALSRRGPR